MNSAALILFFLLISHLAGAAEWYYTTEGGVPGLALSGPGPANSGWSLSIEYADNREIHTLYHDGERESQTQFLRDAGKLVAREEYDNRGVLLSKVEYSYDTEGNPRGIVTTAAVEPSVAPHMAIDMAVNPDGAARRQLSGSGKDWLITDFDTEGRPLRQTVLSDGDISGEILWIRGEDGELKEKRQLFGDMEIHTRFDGDGRIVEEISIKAGSVISLRANTWKGANLIRVEERGAGKLTVRTFSWIGNQLSSETHHIDEIIISNTVYTSATTRTETLYQDGLAVLRVFWDKDERIREEFLRGGEVIRVREAGL